MTTKASRADMMADAVEDAVAAAACVLEACADALSCESPLANLRGAARFGLRAAWAALGARLAR